MPDLSIDEEAARLVTATAEQLTGVRDGECLYCYVARMIDDYGCDHALRFARRYRDQRAPSATGLEDVLESMGGFCDCEIFLNGVTLAGAPSPSDEETDEESLLPEVLPECRGVERGSTRSCGVWELRPDSGW
jgi:hypothetical protein